MQGLADGYFVIPNTIGDYLSGMMGNNVSTDHEAFKKVEEEVRLNIDKLMNIKGTKTVDDFHKELGHIMWDYCGMSRNEKDLKKAKAKIHGLRQNYWKDLTVIGSSEELNMSLEKANRVADFLELGEVMIDDALMRTESCGGHFREESQTQEGEALRKDDDFSFVAAWAYQGKDQQEILHKEHLHFENVKLTQRSYK